MSADLDKAIDGAVREMLDVEPRADLRARVLAQLPASGFWLPASGVRLPAAGWVLGPLAAAALVVLAIMLPRRSEPLPQAPVVAHATDHYLPSDRVAVAPQPRGSVPIARRDRVVASPTAAVPQVARAAQPSGGTVLAAAYLDDDTASSANHASTADPLKS